MITAFFIIVIVLLIEFNLSPRIGYTKEKNILLWYGKRKRKYFVLL